MAKKPLATREVAVVMARASSPMALNNVRHLLTDMEIMGMVTIVGIEKRQYPTQVRAVVVYLLSK